MTLQTLTRKFEDNSTEEGFQFTFYCDLSGEAFKSSFVPSQAGKKASWSRLAGKGISLGASVLDRVPLGQKEGSQVVGDKADALSQEISKDFGNMSPQWHAEHDRALEAAKNDAVKQFHNCPQCRRWVCDYCWSQPNGMCTQDTKNIRLCPSCHQPAGQGKFCNNCGAPLSLKCAKCGEESPAGTKFCGHCGAKLE